MINYMCLFETKKKCRPNAVQVQSRDVVVRESAHERAQQDPGIVITQDLSSSSLVNLIPPYVPG
jgi:hypothetical protein